MSTLPELVETLKQMDDFRRTSCGNFKHSIASVLTCTFCASMAGVFGARSTAHFIQENFYFLNRLVDLPHAVPSHDTINRILAEVDVKILA